jgi:hypothetical protein
MNTPSHILISCAAVGSSPARRLWPALIGGALPDAPIYLFYTYEKLILRAPEFQIWRLDYFSSPIQPVLDALHSFPLILIVLGIALAVRNDLLKWLSLSLILHACSDFPLHHDDAHRQFFPFSGYRFESPVSYWDPRHHGLWGGGIELVVTVFAMAVLLHRHRTASVRAAWAALWLFNLVPFLYWG